MAAINVRAGGGGVMTPEQIRDALLSIPDKERKFVISDPAKGKQRITNIAVDTTTDEQVISTV